MAAMGERFTQPELMTVAEAMLASNGDVAKAESTLRTIVWLTQSNYHIELAPDARIDEIAIFPMSSDESHGMEDLRLTRFIEVIDQIHGRP